MAQSYGVARRVCRFLRCRKVAASAVKFVVALLQKVLAQALLQSARLVRGSVEAARQRAYPLRLVDDLTPQLLHLSVSVRHVFLLLLLCRGVNWRLVPIRFERLLALSKARGLLET